jgi:hypothetical protein
MRHRILSISSLLLLSITALPAYAGTLADQGTPSPSRGTAIDATAGLNNKPGSPATGDLSTLGKEPYMKKDADLTPANPSDFLATTPDDASVSKVIKCFNKQTGC